ncbi:MAG: 50S ribosomal protein L11 methyltransferase [Rhizobiaceae bacterium]
MPQSRLYLSAPRLEAERIYRLVETEFEDDGFPVSIMEADEDLDIHEVSLYLETEDAQAVRARMVSVLGSDTFGLELAQEDFPETDWVTHSLGVLAPVEAGRFIVHGSHDRHAPKAGQIAIEIEAGLAFGTGHHGTTAGCLEMITEVVRNRSPRNALDLGTGSGVLAIAIAHLAKIPVLATDIDPVATRVADENVRLNQAAAWVRCQTATGFHRAEIRNAAPYDLIVANILANPLMKLAPQMAQHLSRGGDIILSGILASQRDKVLAAYRTQALYHRKTLWRNGWVTLHLS